MPRSVIPLSLRRVDLAILAFFFVNILFITYIVDLEQLVIADPAHFAYPIWPPGPLVDLVHWWGNTFDPLQMARPVWWKMTIWIDVLGFGPFYVAAIYAFIKGRDWIRLPSLLYSATMLTNVTIILGEEYAGPHATPHFPIVFLANLAWLVFPIVIIARMWRSETPFTRAGSAAPAAHVATAGQAGGA
jgi:hypothetical protein